MCVHVSLFTISIHVIVACISESIRICVSLVWVIHSYTVVTSITMTVLITIQLIYIWRQPAVILQYAQEQNMVFICFKTGHAKPRIWDSAVHQHINNHRMNAHAYLCIYLLIEYSISICIWVTCVTLPIAICVLLSRVWNANTVILVLRAQYEWALPETGKWCHQSPKLVNIDCTVAMVTFLQVGSRQRSLSSGYPSMSVSLPQR